MDIIRLACEQALHTIPHTFHTYKFRMWKDAHLIIPYQHVITSCRLWDTELLREPKNQKSRLLPYLKTAEKPFQY